MLELLFIDKLNFNNNNSNYLTLRLMSGYTSLKTSSNVDSTKQPSPMHAPQPW